MSAHAVKHCCLSSVFAVSGAVSTSKMLICKNNTAFDSEKSIKDIEAALYILDLKLGDDIIIMIEYV